MQEIWCVKDVRSKYRFPDLMSIKISLPFCLQETGITALMEAAKAGLLELVRAILAEGADPNMVDANDLTAVHYAAMGSFLEVNV